MSLFVVRSLTADDRTGWDRLWQGYLTFYGNELEPEVTERSFARLVERRDGMAGLVAETASGELVGFAHVIEHASTWSGTSVLYLEDLFVDGDTRGSGAGRALIEGVYAEAAARGASETYWITQEGNAVARRLYDRVAGLTDFVRYARDTPAG